jgi:hypothetical protein
MGARTRRPHRGCFYVSDVLPLANPLVVRRLRLSRFGFGSNCWCRGYMSYRSWCCSPHHCLSGVRVCHAPGINVVLGGVRMQCLWRLPLMPNKRLVPTRKSEALLLAAQPQR